MEVILQWDSNHLHALRRVGSNQLSPRGGQQGFPIRRVSEQKLGCRIVDNAYRGAFGMPRVDRLPSSHVAGETEEFTTLAFRHAGEDAVAEPPASQREVATSHLDRASCANHFRPCYLLRAPNP
jgi:hypothetical protein